MPVSAATVGRHARPWSVRLDERMLMAYAAGVPDLSPELYDTTSTLRCHPLYPVSPEWQLLIDNGDVLAGDLDQGEARLGVHAEHDLVLHHDLSAGLDVTVTAEIVGVDRRRAGSARVIRFTARDDADRPLWTTTMGSVFRGVALDGEPTGETSALAPSPPPPFDAVAEIPLEVGPTDALVYTECARIWNPIHTDAAIARSAGLDGPILHGTATLARAVTALTAWHRSPVWSVRRVSARFAAMVPNGTRCTVRVLAADSSAIRFDVRNHVGDPAIRDGAIELN